MGFVRNILNSRSSENGNFFMALQHILGFSPKHLSYYQRAFTHRSLQKKDEFGNDLNFERLEFLGDAILGSVVAAYLYNELPQADEGYLTQMRAKLVSRQYLNQLGKDFDLLQVVETDGHANQLGDNIYGNLFEALIGAIYKDKGYKCCIRFIHRKVIETHVDIHQLEGKIISYKSYMIEWCQKSKKTFKFQTYEDSGNEATKYFAVKFLIDEKVMAKARSTSKKKAEEKASKRAYYALQDKIEG